MPVGVVPHYRPCLLVWYLTIGRSAVGRRMVTILLLQIQRCHFIRHHDPVLLGLELAIDPLPPRGNFVHYDFLKQHYIRHKIKDVSPLRVAA